MIWSLHQPDLTFTLHPLTAAIVRGLASWGIKP